MQFQHIYDVPLYYCEEIPTIDDRDSVKVFQLSPSHAIIPHHALDSSDVIQFESPEADFAIVKLDATTTSFLPFEMHFKGQLKASFTLVADKNITVSKTRFNYIYDVEVGPYDLDFQPGDSGTVYYGEAIVWNERTTVPQLIKIYTPVLMILARNKNNYRIGRAVYLPALARAGIQADSSSSKFSFLRNPAFWRPF